MKHSKLGSTGIEVSPLGFGAMRLPMAKGDDGKQHVKMDESVAMMHRAFELGVNYVDTAWPYCGGESEVAVGRAVRSWTGHRIYVSTKNPTWQVKEPGDYRKHLEQQLERLDMDAVDVYHQHGIGADSWESKVLKLGLLDEARKARDEGLVRHISFSFHDKPEVMKTIVDAGVYETLLCQYNLIDQANADAMAYAHEKGLGVVVMGPIGGGRLIPPEQRDGKRDPGKAASAAQLALRFVLSNPNVDCALSGMGTMAMVEENAAILADGWTVPADEEQAFRADIERRKEMAESYCTACGYCMPCPEGVNIPRCFTAMSLLRVWEVPESAKFHWTQLTKNNQDPSACTECGECEEKCPQNIEIREQLKEAAEALAQLD